MVSSESQNEQPQVQFFLGFAGKDEIWDIDGVLIRKCHKK